MKTSKPKRGLQHDRGASAGSKDSRGDRRSDRDPAFGRAGEQASDGSYVQGPRRLLAAINLATSSACANYSARARRYWRVFSA